MNLRIFFDPIAEANQHNHYESNYWINSIVTNTGTFPDLTNSRIAIVGIKKNAETFKESGKEPADLIRDKLYLLTKGISDQIKIVDLGNLRNGVTAEDTIHRLKEVIEVLLQKEIFPIIIGGEHYLDYGQFLGYEYLERPVNMVNVDAYLDINPSQSAKREKNHIHYMITHKSFPLFHYAHLGYQTYLCDSDLVLGLEKMHFEMYRLGKLREDFKEIEPVLRTGDFISFDISAVKSSDAPGNYNSMPFGMSGEEACQICWYAGLSPKLSSAGFYDYHPEFDVHGKTAQVIAVMIWYLVEGIATKEKAPLLFEEQIKYTVCMPKSLHEIVFYKERITEKWWMEVSYPNLMNTKDQNLIIPCSYNDFETANNGELPDRWILFHSKLK